MPRRCGMSHEDRYPGSSNNEAMVMMPADVNAVDGLHKGALTCAG
jgi:hypothetical protein